MKGLLLNSMDKKEDAYELARKGLKMDLKSHVCWHVLGLLYRSDRNHAEAAKCYKSALRMDPGNGQIMRDLGLLQLHERDLAGYAETRRQLLAAKPGNNQNWLSFAVAEHFRGAPEAALDVIVKMDETFADQTDFGGPYEKSELALYKAMLCIEAGQADKAISILDSPDIVDLVGKNEMLVYLMFLKGDMAGCQSVIKKLIYINSTHEGYLLALLSVMGVVTPSPSAEQVKKWLRLGDTGFASSTDWSTETRVKLTFPSRQVKVLRESTGIVMRDLSSSISSPGELLKTLTDIKAEFLGATTKCDQFDLITLYLLPADSTEFRSRLESFVEAKLNKGVPSTFKMLKGLLSQSDKKRSVVEDCLARFAISDVSNKSPVFKTFGLFALAQYRDYIGEFSRALICIDEAILLTPTLIDLYVLKAKVLKHSNDLAGCSELLEFARKMDLSDRYLNSKSVKALLRIGQIERATETVMLFSKDTVDTKKSNLTEMQCMWWENELAKAHLAAGDVNKALNIWADTRKHYSDMAEDEFDFAFYCLRKMTLRAYVDFLRLEDRIKGHWFFRRMCCGMIPLLLRVAKGEVTESPTTPSKKNRKKDESAQDTKPEPTNWFKDKDVLAEAVALIKELRTTSSEWKGTYKLGFEVHLQKQDFKSCVADVNKLKKLGSSKHAELKAQLVENLRGKPDSERLISELVV